MGLFAKYGIVYEIRTTSPVYLSPIEPNRSSLAVQLLNLFHNLTLKEDCMLLVDMI